MKDVVGFGVDELLVEAVYNNREIRRFIPTLMKCSARFQQRASGGSKQRSRVKATPNGKTQTTMAPKLALTPNWSEQLIDCGCIFAERDREEEVVYFSGVAQVLKRSFDFCVNLAYDYEPVVDVVTRSLTSQPLPTRNWRTREPVKCCRTVSHLPRLNRRVPDSRGT